MTTLYDLIHKYDIGEVMNGFIRYLPKQVNLLDQYFKMVKQLQKLKPVASSKQILIRKKIGEEENTLFYDVCGIIANTETDPLSEDKQGEFWAIEFTDWSIWLGMQIATETMNSFSEIEIMVHCMDEMTFCGFSQAKIKKQFNLLMKLADEAKRNTPSNDNEEVTIKGEG